ncbi:MAG: hypothetical protein M1834_003237 [Cirrosporium novae-zelandiae]|nr:MAG: hypothetical protein M1834_003237 [Cirrosporium novae-zelandiae]
MKDLSKQLGVWTLSVLSLLTVTCSGATFTPILPPSYPLAVRNPYLSAWLPGSQASNLPSSSPQFWAGNNLTWSVIARVNNETYNLFGVPNPESGTQSATVLSGEYTSTHSIFSLKAGTANITLDFLSPVSLNNYVRQSLPFSYLTVSVDSTGSSSPSVQIYSDIDDTWTGQSSSTTWNYTNSGSTYAYQLSANGRARYSQNSNDMALWGEAVYATEGSSVTSASGDASTIRSEFVSGGSLSSGHSSWTAGGVTAFAHDLGTLDNSTSVTFAIGYVREAAVNYLGSAQTGYYRATYANTVPAVAHFLDDYDSASSEADSVDSTISSAGDSISDNYTAILALSTRQILGGIDLTIPADTLSTSDAKAFIKEISSDGNVNTVDVIYPTFPIFYLLNPEWIRLLLEPVLEYVTSGVWDEEYAIHDIGSNYPNATGHPLSQEEKMPVEETGNVLILAYAYQVASGNTDWADGYSALFLKYANYLVDNGLYPVKQLSTNDAIGSIANQTNLGIKAAVGLSAYGNLTSQSNYSSIGTSFAHTIYNERLGTDTSQTYFTLQYGSSTWFMVFNLFPDKLLDLNTFDTAALDMQSEFYQTVGSTYGVPLDGALTWGKTDWQMWAAAAAGDTTRDKLINNLYSYIANGLNTVPFSDRYYTTSGYYNSFRARPTIGGHFASIALSKGANGLSTRRR